jgi:hypothetical protein
METDAERVTKRGQRVQILRLNPLDAEGSSLNRDDEPSLPRQREVQRFKTPRKMKRRNAYDKQTNTEKATQLHH